MTADEALAFRTYRWLGLEFDVPPSWEIVRHTTSALRGSLTLIDRRRQRLEVRWSDCQQAPDIERLVADFKSQVQGDKGKLLEPENGFRGLVSEALNGELTTRAVRWDAATKRLLELTVLASEGDPPELLSRLLGSVQSSRGHAERYSAFDVDVELPQGLSIAQATVKPADVLLEFEETHAEGKKRASQLASVHRFGMADTWFSGDLGALIRRENARSRLAFSERRHGPHQACFASGRAAGAVLPRMLGLVPERRVLAWMCRERNSLFLVTTSSKKKRPLLPEQLVVRCCGEVA